MRNAIVISALLVAVPAIAQNPPAPSASGYVEVTATKIEEDVMPVPSSITVISGADIERRAAYDLPSALALAGGVAVGAGGDAGPASVVPELWGLREADAFLLVVDGVPYGGAFNPSTAEVDLHDVERIEIVRGSAPVVYGATAFSGVIQVIHRRDARRFARVSAGSFGSAAADVTAGGLTANVERQRFRDDRSGADRAHLLYRADLPTASGVWRFTVDGLKLNQDPASPHPREGATLSPRVALDTNFNPRGAHIDESRVQFNATYVGMLGSAPWTTTISAAHSRSSILRGFLSDLDNPEAAGFTQKRRITDLYLESHVVEQLSSSLRVVGGIDHLAGRASAGSGLFDYPVTLGGDTPQGSTLVPDEFTDLHDNRDFSAAWAQAEWTIADGIRVDFGGRLNHTRERRDEETQTNDRFSGFAGLSRRIGADVWAFADVRDTFKPALIDFGPEDEDGEGILDPETSRSYEVGIRQRAQQFSWQATAFLMNMNNLVVSTVDNGLPALENGGRQRFRGFEVEGNWSPVPNARLEASLARHDARFRDYEQAFDGVVTQLDGKRIEMSPRDLASIGGSFGAASGWRGSLAVNYTGERMLNKRNTALAGGFTTVSAGVGYAAGFGEIRVDGTNLTNRRDPVSESELGDAQYYLVPARAIRVSYSRSF